MTWTVIIKNSKGFNNDFHSFVFNGPAGRAEAIKELASVADFDEQEILCLVRGNHEILFNEEYLKF